MSVDVSQSEPFDDFFNRATGGFDPYPYQAKIAFEGFPEVLAVPTGAGKTAAAILGWLYRRRFQPDPEVRAHTPRWLVYVLPMRVLVEQTLASVEHWLDNLGLLPEVAVYRVVGGEGRIKSNWRYKPEHDAVFVGTLDMVTSRQLNRGYGEGRFVWPIDFGLFNNGCHFVYDEIQLMGPALPTSRQLHGLRRLLGSAMECSATWMSATVDLAQLDTVDAPEIQRVVDLSTIDRDHTLGRRLSAPKLVTQLAVPERSSYEESIATALLEQHGPGTLTLAILNTVERARKVFDKLRAHTPGAEIVLLHSRFRPPDRHRQAQAALAKVDADGPGRIVVSTQVVEAGVDISARLLFTEAAPWPSLVQRSGRCNRDGQSEDAVLLWTPPPKQSPYHEADVKATANELRHLEGQAVTPDTLGLRPVRVTSEVHAVLRRKDLFELFDTLPDLTGTDVDISQFIREGEDLDLDVAWRLITADGPGRQETTPRTEERCPVPIGEVRAFLKKRHRAWRFDHLAESWVTAKAADVRPGIVLLMAADAGGYLPETGWTPQSKDVVPVLDEPNAHTPDAVAEGTSDDPLTYVGSWVSLSEHLDDVEGEVRRIMEHLAPAGLAMHQREAAALAARYHDWGKVHPCFQEMLIKTEDDETARQRLQSEGPWAKSAGGRGPRNERRYFRHELASALALIHCWDEILAGTAEPDLILYLVASHHGRIRLAFRPLPDETSVDGRVRALGIEDGEDLPGVDMPGRSLPASRLDLSVMGIGAIGDSISWSARMLSLRDRSDLGPFRLGFLESAVRVADWIASASYRPPVTEAIHV